MLSRMPLKKLEEFLHEQIPLTEALGVKIIKSDDSGAEVTAPLAPNRNHLGTVFGGSLHSVLVLSAYLWLFHALEKKGISNHVVLMSSHTDYLHPVTGEFKAVCPAPKPEDFKRLMRTLERRGRARIRLHAHISTAKGLACVFSGDFVAHTT
jgi:thioesterase domain-containing protein